MTIASRFVLKALDRLALGRLTMRLPNGTTRVFGSVDAEPAAEIDVTNWRFFERDCRLRP